MSTTTEMTRNAGLATTGRLFDSLEPRIVLSAIDNLPTVADLEPGTETSNPVVVLETTLGDIYLELFQQDAPNTVANFLEYVERGLYGESFFHRLAGGNSNPFALQGGGYAFDADGEIDFIFDPDLGPINSEFGRPNEARTIAMALSGGNTNSATSQFFINLINNSTGGAQLDQQGFTVFGRVITNQSWNVVQSIVAFGADSFSSDPAVTTQLTDRFDRPLFRQSGTGTVTLSDTGNPLTGAGAFDDLITLPTQMGTLDANEVIEIENAQVVKPIDNAAFYTQQVAYPEGYASFSSREVLRLNNTNASAVDVQVIVRYEDGLRDFVVFQGDLAADEAREIILHDAFNPNSTSLVRLGVPYAIEVFTASDEEVPVPVTAAMQRFDFGNGAGESFFNITDQSARSDAWYFAAVAGAPGSRGFVTFQNTGGSNQQVTIEIEGFDTSFSRTITLGAYRRGGIEISSLIEAADLAPGTAVAVEVFTQSGDPVLVAQTTSFGIFDTGEDGTGAPAKIPTPDVDQYAIMSLGVPELSRVNTLAATFLPANGSAELALFNPTSQTQIVTFQIVTDGAPFTGIPVQIMSPGEQTILNLSTLLSSSVNDETPFTLTYRSSSGEGVAGTILIVADDGPGLRDIYASAVQHAASTEAHFADSFFASNTANYVELLSIFNPYAAQDLRYFVQYRFSDGSVVSTSPTQIGANARIDIALDSVAGVVGKVGGDDDFRMIGISVFGLGDTGDDNPFELVTALHRIDSRTGVLNQSLSSGPTLLFDPILLEDPRFVGGIN